MYIEQSIYISNASFPRMFIIWHDAYLYYNAIFGIIMQDVLKNPMLSDVLNLLHINKTKYFDSNWLIATIYKYQSME